jgi:hypothetical protein
MGEHMIKRLLIIGGSSMVLCAPCPDAKAGSWLERMLARRQRMLIFVALANDMTRLVWAMLTKKEYCRARAAITACSGRTARGVGT